MHLMWLFNVCDNKWITRTTPRSGFESLERPMNGWNVHKSRQAVRFAITPVHAETCGPLENSEQSGEANFAASGFGLLQ